MEIRVTENNIIPFHKPVKKEIKVVKWVNQPNILVRNANATEYIETCAKRKVREKIANAIWCVVASAGMVLPFILTIFGTLF